MKLIFAVSLFGIVVAEKLTNVYLPPAGATNSGGSGNFLLTPLQTRNTFSQNVKSQLISPVYGTPFSNYQTQSHYSARPLQITRYINENNGDGSYQFDYETENKIRQQEVGQLRNPGTNQESSIVHGSYSYAAPDGQVYTVDYVADENGFRPSGAHLPTPPPIPDEILKSLQVNAAAEASGFYDDGQYRQYKSGAQILKQDSGYHY